MRIGLMGLNIGATNDPVVARAAAQLAEALGYDSLWVGDHPVLPRPPLPGSPFPPGLPFGAPLVALANLIPVTESIRLGTGVLLLPQRQPVHLAKEIATLDHLSSGRVLLGVGAGYMEAEFRAVGASMDRRGARIEECLAVMRELWSSDAPTFRGSDFTVQEIEFLPRPAQRGGPPIIFGGHSRAALARTARMGDGWMGWFMRPDQVGRRVEHLRGLPRDAGRAPVEVSVMPPDRLTAESVTQYAEAGVDRLIVMPTPSADAEAVLRFVTRNAPAELGA